MIRLINFQPHRIKDCEAQGLESSWMSVSRQDQFTQSPLACGNLREHQDAQVSFGWIKRPFSFLPCQRSVDDRLGFGMKGRVLKGRPARVDKQQLNWVTLM